MDRARTALAVAFVLVASLVGAGVVATPGDAQPGGNASTQSTASVANATPESGTTISVSAAGTVSAQPDSAVVRVAASATAANASGATQALAANASTLRGALVDAGIPRDAVRTTDFQVFERRDEDGDVVYVARQAFAVTVSNTADVGRVIDVAVANGATDVFGVEFQLSAERRRALRERAIGLAVADAREQAAAAAASANLTLGGVRSIAVGDGSVTPLVERAAADTDIDVSPVTVTATVQVTYNATDGGG